MRVSKILIVYAVLAVVICGLFIWVRFFNSAAPLPDSAADGPFVGGNGGASVDVRAEFDSPLSEESATSADFSESEAAEEKSPVSIESINVKPASLPGNFPANVPGVISQIALQMDPPLRDIGKAWLSESGRNDFTMPLPNGGELEISVDRFVVIGEDGGEFIGTVKGYPDSVVNLSYRGRGEAGSIRLPSENRMYAILPGPTGTVLFQEREYSDSATVMVPPVSTSDIPPAPNFTPPPPPELPEFLR